jgi:hypothetical protein
MKDSPSTPKQELPNVCVVNQAILGVLEHGEEAHRFQSLRKNRQKNSPVILHLFTCKSVFFQAGPFRATN